MYFYVDGGQRYLPGEWPETETRAFDPEGAVDRYLDFPESERHLPGRFMLYVTPVREEKRDVLPAITHEDGSGRLQTVYKDTNPAYHRVIERFGEITGVPVVMNTSFNLHGEAIVESPADAISTLLRSELDVLVFDSLALRRLN